MLKRVYARPLLDKRCSKARSVRYPHRSKARTTCDRAKPIWHSWRTGPTSSGRAGDGARGPEVVDELRPVAGGYAGASGKDGALELGA